MRVIARQSVARDLVVDQAADSMKLVVYEGFCLWHLHMQVAYTRTHRGQQENEQEVKRSQSEAKGNKAATSRGDLSG
jgi:hypothetical protein